MDLPHLLLSLVDSIPGEAIWVAIVGAFSALAVAVLNHFQQQRAKELELVTTEKATELEQLTERARIEATHEVEMVKTAMEAWREMTVHQGAQLASLTRRLDENGTRLAACEIERANALGQIDQLREDIASLLGEIGRRQGEPLYRGERHEDPGSG